MEFNKLVRDPDRVKKYLRDTPDGKLIALKPCKIYIPVRFEEHKLASIGAEIHIIGHYTLVMEDTFYTVCNINSMMEITPMSTIRVLVDGEEYYEFSFDAGSVIIPNLNLVKRDTCTYDIFDEIVSRVNVPFYMSYIDMGRIHESAKYYADANVGANQEVIETIISLVARDPKDRSKYRRQTITSLDDARNNRPQYVPLKSVQGATNTTNRLAGSYQADGMIGALAHPAKRTERIENLLRL